MMVLEILQEEAVNFKKNEIMTQNLVNIYNIKLYNKSLGWEGFSGKENIKSIETNNAYLTDFQLLNSLSDGTFEEIRLPEKVKICRSPKRSPSI